MSRMMETLAEVWVLTDPQFWYVCRMKKSFWPNFGFLFRFWLIFGCWNYIHNKFCSVWFSSKICEPQMWLKFSSVLKPEPWIGLTQMCLERTVHVQNLFKNGGNFIKCICSGPCKTWHDRWTKTCIMSIKTTQFAFRVSESTKVWPVMWHTIWWALWISWATDRILGRSNIMSGAMINPSAMLLLFFMPSISIPLMTVAKWRL